MKALNDDLTNKKAKLSLKKIKEQEEELLQKGYKRKLIKVNERTYIEKFIKSKR